MSRTRRAIRWIDGRCAMTLEGKAPAQAKAVHNRLLQLMRLVLNIPEENLAIVRKGKQAFQLYHCHDLKSYPRRG